MRRLAVAAQSSVVSERFSEGLVFIGLLLCGFLSKLAILPRPGRGSYAAPEFEKQPALASIIIFTNFENVVKYCPTAVSWRLPLMIV